MPASLIAAAVLLTLFVPGYLFQHGVREYASVATAERDVYAVAQAVGISAGILAAIFLPLAFLQAVGVGPAESLQRDLLHAPTNAGDDPGLTVAQAVVLIALLVFPNALGKFFGRTMQRRREQRLELPDQEGTLAGQSAPQQDSSVHEGGRRNPIRVRAAVAAAWNGLLGFFFSSSPIDNRIDEVVRSVREDSPTYVRLVRQGTDDVIGLADTSAAHASSSALGQGLALTARWVRDPEHGWQRLGGAHVGKSGLISIQYWNRKGTEGQENDPVPAWLAGVGPV